MKNKFDFNEAMISLIADELFCKRYGEVPDWACKNKLTWFIWWHFRGGKAWTNINIASVHAVRDYIAWFEKMREVAEQ